jgi:limonene-1,2-epoxide hydrolase
MSSLAVINWDGIANAITALLGGLALILTAYVSLTVARMKQSAKEIAEEVKATGQKVTQIDHAVNNRPVGAKTVEKQVGEMHDREFPPADIGVHPLVHQIATDIKTLLEGRNDRDAL